MDPHEMNVSQMLWQPPLIQLTQTSNPEHDEGKETVLYVAPQLITVIRRSARVNTVFPKEGESKDVEPTWGQIMSVTEVVLGNGVNLCIKESPEFVAMLRDKALGHNVKLTLPVNK